MAKTVGRTPEGVEILVETGFGHVTRVEHDEGRRNAKVSIEAEGLRLPVTGWADTTDPTIWEEVLDAESTGKRIAYRVEIHRHAEVDKQLPMAQVDPKARHRRLVGLDWVHQMTPAEPEPEPEANPVVSDFDPGPEEPPEEARGPRIQEGKPWERTNSDGSLNLGSYAFLASVGMVEWAFELLSIHRDDPTPIQIKHLAAMLLDAADQVQLEHRSDGRVDRMDTSHTRARGAVRCVVQVEGVPWERIAKPAERLGWVQYIVARAGLLLSIAKELDR